MREFGRVPTLIWNGPLAREIRGDHLAQALAANLYSGRAANLIGLFSAPLPILAHELGAKEPRVRAAIERLKGAKLERHPFLKYDEASELAFLPEAAGVHIGTRLLPTDNRHKYVQRELATIGSHPYVEEFLQLWGAAFHLGPAGAPWEGPSGGPSEGPSKPPPSIGEMGDREGETGMGEGESTPPSIRPDSSANLIHCLRVAIEASRPEVGMWTGGDMAHRIAREFFEGVPSDQRSRLVTTIEQRIPRFVADPRAQKSGLRVKDFVDLFDSLGQVPENGGRDVTRGWAAPSSNYGPRGVQKL